MRYKALFESLHEYAMNEPNLNLHQFKDVCTIIWSKMAPTEQDLFKKDFHKNIVQMKLQESIPETLKRVLKKKLI